MPKRSSKTKRPRTVEPGLRTPEGAPRAPRGGLKRKARLERFAPSRLVAPVSPGTPAQPDRLDVSFPRARRFRGVRRPDLVLESPAGRGRTRTRGPRGDRRSWG